ncbi:MAG: NADPH-dependent FMN reductase [Chloroflexi bacterium RBG_16_72_14]|nr:MAG: NADPH-dependent FMN reductase [Chloroflexi bacterium RBG_16_72_14]
MANAPTPIRRRTIVVVHAGLGQPSATRLLADRLAAATVGELAAKGIDAGVTMIELRDHAQDLVSNLLTGFPSPVLQASIEDVVGADGLIAVTPVYSASYSGLFKLFFDVLERDALAGVPVLVAATAGTARHSLALDHALRPLFVYLGAAVVPTAVFAAAEDWGTGGDPMEPSLADRIARAGRELATALVTRDAKPGPDPFADPVPFEQLLARDQG